MLRDAYAVAHGMAMGYLMSNDVRPETVAQLARLDARAGVEMRALHRCAGFRPAASRDGRGGGGAGGVRGSRVGGHALTPRPAEIEIRH